MARKLPVCIFLVSMRRITTIFAVWALSFSCLVYADPEPLRFAAIGDMGCGCPAQEAVADEMLQWYRQNPFTFVLTTGDNIYGDNFTRLLNRRRGGNKELFYQRFDRYYNALRNRGVLFFATLGNHDLETRNGRDLIEDRRRFNILSKTGYYYFSPDPKLATFVALNTEALLYTNEKSEQLKWLQNVLSESKSTWKIVFGHHPLYSPPGSHSLSVTLQKLLEPILVRNAVNIYIAGHNHFYARMKPQHGILHFTTGGGGRHLKTPRRTSQTDVIAGAYHFMHFEVTEAELKYYAIPTQGKLLDQGSIHISVE